MNISKIVSALALLGSAVDPVINATKGSIDAEIDRFEQQVQHLANEKLTVTGRYTTLFNELRAEIKSVRGLHENSSGAQRSVFQSTLTEKQRLYDELSNKQREELNGLEDKIRANRQVQRELKAFKSGIPMSRSTAELVDNKIKNINQFVFEQVGQFFRNMTNPAAGGVGMPSAKNGGYEGFGSAFVGEEIDPTLSDADKALLFETVSKCTALRLRFVDARAPYWSKLTLAARQYALIQAAVGAENSPTVPAEVV